MASAVAPESNAATTESRVTRVTPTRSVPSESVVNGTCSASNSNDIVVNSFPKQSQGFSI